MSHSEIGYFGVHRRVKNEDDNVNCGKEVSRVRYGMVWYYRITRYLMMVSPVKLNKVKIGGILKTRYTW